MVTGIQMVTMVTFNTRLPWLHETYSYHGYRDTDGYHGYMKHTVTMVTGTHTTWLPWLQGYRWSPWLQEYTPRSYHGYRNTHHAVTMVT
jgi:hypothetical protein